MACASIASRPSFVKLSSRRSAATSEVPGGDPTSTNRRLSPHFLQSRWPTGALAGHAGHRPPKRFHPSPLVVAGRTAVPMSSVLFPPGFERRGFRCTLTSTPKPSRHLPEPTPMSLAMVAIAFGANRVSHFMAKRLQPIVVSHVDGNSNPHRRPILDHTASQPSLRKHQLDRPQLKSLTQPLEFGCEQFERVSIFIGRAPRQAACPGPADASWPLVAKAESGQTATAGAGAQDSRRDRFRCRRGQFDAVSFVDAREHHQANHEKHHDRTHGPLLASGHGDDGAVGERAPVVTPTCRRKQKNQRTRRASPRV